MAKVVGYGRYSLVIAYFIVCAAVSMPAFAQSGGYEGLIAPPADSAASAPPPASPADEPPGYSGVIPGGVEAETAKEQAPSMIGTPEPQSPPAPKTSDDIRLLALKHGGDHDGDGLRDDFMKNIKIPAQAPLQKRRRIDNMLPMEFAVKRNIEQLMAGIGDEKISAEDRAKKAGQAREALVKLAEGLHYKATIPDKTYQQMGLSDSFIAEEHEGTDKALSRLDLALKELEKY